jgi:hypothetical protein
MKRFAKGLVRICQGAFEMVLGLLSLRQARMISAMRTAAMGLGMLTGSFGVATNEYRRPAERRIPRKSRHEDQIS